MKHIITSTPRFRVVVLLAAAALAAALLGLVQMKPAEAAFPGNNGKIAFVSNRDDRFVREIYAMSADGSGQTNLTNTPGLSEGLPSFSADGTKITYSAGVLGVTEEVWVMNADGSGQTNLTNEPTAFDFNPAFSPDGTKIVFSSTRDAPFGFESDIFVMNVDGSNVVNLTGHRDSAETLSHDLNPSFSPDGTKIVFDGKSDNCDACQGIWVMNADGSGETELTQGPFDSTEPDFLPDGTKIAFVGPHESSPLGFESDIFVMNADGTGRTNLTNTPFTAETSPTFSPDGTKIAFRLCGQDCGIFSEPEIYVMNADGSGQTNLTNNPADDSSPSWQPLPQAPAPKTKAECKKGGYKTFGFKNKGQCIKAVSKEATED